MKKLLKEETEKNIYEIFDFIDNGIVEYNGKFFYGHPGLYFFHSKEELRQKINSYLDKDSYDKYDLFYMVSKLIKFMLGKYDSHTKIMFETNKFLPLELKVETGNVRIINQSSSLNDVKGGYLLSINGVKIDKILSEIEEITCYSTKEFLTVSQEYFIQNIENLKTLPSVSNEANIITLEVFLNNKIEFLKINIEDKFSKIENNSPENYSFEVFNDAILIHYNSCLSKTDERMLNLIQEVDLVSKEKGIVNFIIDLRNNMGGNSEIIKPLARYLEDKNVVVLVNEKVFSSGRMAYVELKKIGAYAIGTDISTSLNSFGNVLGEFVLKDLGLKIKRSSSYWFYDDSYTCIGFRKDTFSSYFKDKRELLEPLILHPDKYVYLTSSDIIKEKDPQLEEALKYLSLSQKYKNN